LKDEPLEVDRMGVIHGIRSFVPHLVRQGTGHVVNTSSFAGIYCIPFNGVYSAAKQAVLSLSETLRAGLAEVAPGVRVTVVCSGVVRTRIRESARLRPPEPPERPDWMPTPPPEDSTIEPEQVAQLVDASASSAEYRQG
jgi:short-subunit dehydrogenase